MKMKVMTYEESKLSIYGLCEILTSNDRKGKDRVQIDNVDSNMKSYKILTVGVMYGIDCGLNILDFRAEFPPRVQDTDSHQVRVKAVYKNSKGYYIKTPKKLYLADYVVKTIEATWEISN